VSEELITMPGYQHPAHNSWKALRQRCFDENHKSFPQYGGRGITVCPEWKESFRAFWSDMGETWFEGATIDRKDPDENYNKENCRWATWEEQQQENRRDRSENQRPGPKPGAVYKKRSPEILNPDFLTLNQAAAKLNITPRQLRKYATRGLIAYSRPPGKRIWFFTEPGLEDFVGRYYNSAKKG
jgi:hypothetical protein